MIMILAYLIIGLLYSSITMYPVARDVGQRKKHDGVYSEYIYYFYYICHLSRSFLDYSSWV
ncbi:hypothetical protein ACQJ2X_07565 [Bacillus wiedmannii]|uniref:hypothetical protein n=1 Tax=Bacillus wiedmannii TaxID=1890302 RepID=UPI003CF083B7